MKLLFVMKGLVVILGLFYLLASSVIAAQVTTSIAMTSKPNLVLLKEFDPNQNVIGWLMSEKLDGVRAYWDGQQLMSRNGHIFSTPDWFIEGFPSFELDGELWIDRHQFEQTVSIVRTQSSDKGWHTVTYQIFEVPNQPAGLIDRLAVLKGYLQKTSIPHVRIIKQTAVTKQEEVKKQLQEVLSLGGEGLVLREPNALYYSGRSSNSLKVKQKQDAECSVVGYTEGKGKYSGMVGALRCQLLAGQFSALTSAKDRIIKIGSGLTDLIRAEPPIIGSVVTFQYMGFTAKGLPRFPVFLRFRLDDSLSN